MTEVTAISDRTEPKTEEWVGEVKVKEQLKLKLKLKLKNITRKHYSYSEVLDC